MSSEITPNTQAILLLTAPLRQGRADDAVKPLSVREYRFLVRLLIDKGKEPADLLGSDAGDLFRAAGEKLDSERLERLLARGFLLAQALERWRARSIWVVSRADAQYPTRIKRRLRDSAPPVLYGCGDPGILETGGLAVVGSRAADDSLLTYAEDVGNLAAEAGITLLSGGARGIDSAAMKGAAAVGGRVVGVLADKLEGAVVNRENRAHLMTGRLALISPYDPSAGFNVGHAMQRNKLIYALADAGLVVSADLEKGGTWAGAVEQLERLRYVPIFVRSAEPGSAGLDELRAQGGLAWPSPRSGEELRLLLSQWERKSAANRNIPFTISNSTYTVLRALAARGRRVVTTAEIREAVGFDPLPMLGRDLVERRWADPFDSPMMPEKRGVRITDIGVAAFELGRLERGDPAPEPVEPPAVRTGKARDVEWWDANWGPK